MLLKLLSLPVSLPLAGIRFCLDQLVEAAEQELTDDAPIREALLLLSLQLDEGEISDDDYVEREAILIDRLREIRAYKERRVRDGATEASPVAISMDRGSVVVELHEDLRGGP